MNAKAINFLLNVALGFVFRIYVIFLLFLWGIELINITQEGQFSTWFKVIPVSLVFMSLYLFYNSLTKKITEATYEKWSVAAIIFLGILLVCYVYAVINYGGFLPPSFETLMYGFELWGIESDLSDFHA